MRLGIHMPLKGGFQQNIARLKEFGVETVQIFPGNPTGWHLGAADQKEIAKRLFCLDESAVYPLVMHSAYLINLASPTANYHQKSIQLLQETMERAALHSSPYVVLHTGNHGGQGAEQGIEQIIETIGAGLPGWPDSVKLLLENTAGSGTALGSRFEELARIRKAFPPGALGICFDTAHGWAAGYDCGSVGGVDSVLAEFDQIIGLEHLLAVHLNDSKARLGSRVDRHEHIGRGAIKLEGFKTLLSQNWPAGFPFILETPEIGTDWDRLNLETVRTLKK